MKGELSEVVIIEVDYSLALGEMIKAGNYDKVDASINPKTFRLEKAGCRKISITLVQFGQPMSPLEILKRMESRGYRPAILEELLAIGSNKLELQRSIPIVALGSGPLIDNNNRRYVPCLGGSQSWRELNLVVIYRRWSIYYRFAFVKC